MSTSHSENWAFLLKLLTENSGKGSYSDGNLSRHQQAYALALFLVDAVLATPELNRCNVDALIAGELSGRVQKAQTNSLVANIRCHF